MARRHVVPREKDWAVVAPGAKRASSVHDTQAAAEAAAKRLVGRRGGGEVVIHRPDGQIRDSDTVKPGRDPNPPRDLKH
jgi:hypothetical protein